MTHSLLVAVHADSQGHEQQRKEQYFGLAGTFFPSVHRARCSHATFFQLIKAFLLACSLRLHAIATTLISSTLFNMLPL